MASPRLSRSRSQSRRRRRSSSRTKHDNATSKSRSGSPRSASPTRLSANELPSPTHASETKEQMATINHVTLRVENLTRNVNADHLREIFGKFGLVVRVDMAVPRGKASALVILATLKDAETAKDHLHGGWLDGNNLRVLPQDPPKHEGTVRAKGSRTVTRSLLSPLSRARRGARFIRSPSLLARGRQRSPLRGGARGRRGASPFRGRSRSLNNNNRRGARSRSPAFLRRRGPSPFRSGRRSSPLPVARGGGRRRRSPSPFRRRRSLSRSRSFSRSRSRTRGRSRSRTVSRSRSRSRGRSFSSRSRSSSRGRRRRSSSRSRSSRSSRS